VLMTATKRPRRANQATAEQEQTGRFRNFTLRRRKTAETPLIDVLERRAVQALHRDAVDNGAFSRLDTEEVLAVGINREHLIKNLSAKERVVHRELYLGRRGQARGYVDVENQLGKGGAVFELDGRVREGRVAGAADEYRLTAADTEIAAAGSGSEIDDKTSAGAVEIALHERTGVDQTTVIEKHVIGILVIGVSYRNGNRIGPNSR